MNPLAIWLPLAVSIASACLSAQVDRYELGLRLRACERRLAAASEPTRRAAALAELERAVQAFFRLDTTTVARAISAADQELRGGSPDPATAVADSLQLVLPQRLIDRAEASVALQLSAAFPCDAEWPADLQLQVRLGGETEPRLSVPLPAVPASLTLSLAEAPAGDLQVTWSLHQRERVLLVRSHGLSLVSDLAPRLRSLQTAADAAETAPRSIESTSLPSLLRLLRSMTLARREETVLPGSRLLAEAEALAAAVRAGTAHHGPQHPGEHWLRVPVGAKATSVRMLVPATEPGQPPRPLVLALHGAGGSENLFFDGYGDGAIVALCQQRGWFLVAPRSEAFGAGDLPGLLDALASRWPIDPRRVLLIGHSMGAAQAVAAAARNPERFAAVAALGGGGRPGRGPGIDKLPWWVAAGERDFGRPQASALHRALLAAGARSAYREYPGVEHLTIVQFALPDAFGFFDASLAAVEPAGK